MSVTFMLRSSVIKILHPRKRKRNMFFITYARPITTTFLVQNSIWRHFHNERLVIIPFMRTTCPRFFNNPRESTHFPDEPEKFTSKRRFGWAVTNLPIFTLSIRLSFWPTTTYNRGHTLFLGGRRTKLESPFDAWTSVLAVFLLHDNSSLEKPYVDV